jgi:hypothetical protein
MSIVELAKLVPVAHAYSLRYGLCKVYSRRMPSLFPGWSFGYRYLQGKGSEIYG